MCVCYGYRVSLLPDKDPDDLTPTPLIPDPPDEDHDETSALLGVVHPPERATLIAKRSIHPPDVAADAIRDAAAWVDGELVRLRGERERINDEIRDLVTEQDRLKRLVRVLDAS